MMDIISLWFAVATGSLLLLALTIMGVIMLSAWAFTALGKLHDKIKRR